MYQPGVQLDHLEETGRTQDPMIVLTSDHGDCMGDHWLSERVLFHEPSIKTPRVRDQGQAKSALTATLSPSML